MGTSERRPSTLGPCASLPPAPSPTDLLQQALLLLSQAPKQGHHHSNSARPAATVTRQQGVDSKEPQSLDSKPPAFTRWQFRKDAKPATGPHSACAPRRGRRHLHRGLPSSSPARGLVSGVSGSRSCTPREGLLATIVPQGYTGAGALPNDARSCRPPPRCRRGLGKRRPAVAGGQGGRSRGVSGKNLARGSGGQAAC